jgi:hypothetical protein
MTQQPDPSSGGPRCRRRPADKASASGDGMHDTSCVFRPGLDLLVGPDPARRQQRDRRREVRPGDQHRHSPFAHPQQLADLSHGHHRRLRIHTRIVSDPDTFILAYYPIVGVLYKSTTRNGEVNAVGIALHEQQWRCGDRVLVQHRGRTCVGRISSIHRTPGGVEYVVHTDAAGGGVGHVLNVWSRHSGPAPVSPVPGGVR